MERRGLLGILTRIQFAPPKRRKVESELIKIEDRCLVCTEERRDRTCEEFLQQKRKSAVDLSCPSFWIIL
jgi:hypothetical protein